MKHGIHLDAKTKVAIIKALKDGRRPSDIERTVGVSDKTIVRIRRENGLPEFRPRPTPEERTRILDAIEQGQSNTAISATFKRSRSFIWKIRRSLVATSP
jgi:hypothetical protein